MCEIRAFFVSVANRKHLILALLLAAFAGGLAGCGTRPSAEMPATQVVVEDDLGRAVQLPGKVQRAVSLAPSVTESIFAAGAGDRLVGVTTYCNYPEAAKSIEKVGDTQTPNVERIIALKPDVVFVSTASQLEAFADTLAKQNIAVFVTDATDLAGVNRNLRAFGAIFGTSSAADAAAEEMERRVQTVSALPQPASRPKVFVQISEEPLFTIGSGSFLTDLVSQAGGVSATRDVVSAYPKLSKETAAAMDPDVIILSDSDDNRNPNAAFANAPAVKNRRVHKINADIISRPGPRSVDALEELSQLIRK